MDQLLNEKIETLINLATLRSKMKAIMTKNELVNASSLRFKPVTTNNNIKKS